MQDSLKILNNIRIATPCPASWDDMKGDDRVRHCDLCRLNVYNISEMSAEQAVRLISESESRVCLRLYRRRDGTVITADCPRGLALVRRKLGRVAAAVGALWGLSISNSACVALGAVVCEPKTTTQGARQNHDKKLSDAPQAASQPASSRPAQP